jgi:hypothetical protein
MLLKSKSVLILLTIFSVLLMVSCATTRPPSLVIVGVSKEAYWENGKKYLKSMNDGIDISLSYVKKSKNVLIFDVIINNNSENQIIVNPANFNLKTFGDSLVKSINKKALNPSGRIAYFENMQDREESKYQGGSSVESCFLCFELISDITRKEPLTKKEIAQRERDEERRRLDRLEDELRGEKAVRKLMRSQMKLESESLRRTTLNQGDYVIGKIFFKLSNYDIGKGVLCDGDRITVSINVGDIKYSYEFAARWKENL